MQIEEWIERSGRDLTPSPSPSYRAGLPSNRLFGGGPARRQSGRQSAEPEAASKVAAALCQLLGKKVVKGVSKCTGIPA